MAVTVGPTVPTESSTGVPAGGFSQWFRNIGDWLKSLSPVGAAQYDTDWVNLTIASGFAVQGSPAPAARRIGKTIHLRGLIRPATGSFVAGQSYVIATVPGSHATLDNWYPPGRTNNAAVNVNYDLKGDGSITAATNGTASWVSLAGIIYTAP